MSQPVPGYPTPITDTRWWWGWGGWRRPGIPTDPPLVNAVAAPTVEDIRTWCEVAPTVVTDAVLTMVLGAEIELQAARVSGLGETYPAEMPSSLHQALLRRVARQLAARGVPLGVTGADEYGPVVLPSYDTEIERLEAPWRAMPVG